MGRKKLNRTKIQGVYKITNTVNNKIYIGSSKDIELRWKAHIKSLNDGTHHSVHLQNAWNKYGQDKFEFEVIELADDNSNISYLRKREQYYLDLYEAYNPDIGYNINKRAEGGKNSFTFEDLHNGKCPFTEDQFWRIVDELQDPYASVTQLAREMGLKESYVQKIVDGQYVELCKDIFIPKRRAYFQERELELEEYGINEIIEELGLN